MRASRLNSGLGGGGSGEEGRQVGAGEVRVERASMAGQAPGGPRASQPHSHHAHQRQTCTRPRPCPHARVHEQRKLAGAVQPLVPGRAGRAGAVQAQQGIGGARHAVARARALQGVCLWGTRKQLSIRRKSAGWGNKDE